MRIEIDEMGRHVIVLSEDVVEEFMIEDGDSVDYVIKPGAMLLKF